MEGTEQLYKALVAAQAELTAPPKSSTAKGDKFSYNYAPLDVVIAHVRPVLAKHGLGFIQDVSAQIQQVGVQTLIIHNSGETYRTGLLVLGCPADPQKAGSAITYARRYSLLGALGIMPEEEDDDGVAAKQPAHRGATSRAPQPAAKPVDAEKETKQRQAIREMILEMEGGDVKAAKSRLFELTTFTGKDREVVAGVQSIDQLTGRRLEVTYGKTKDQHNEMFEATEPVEDLFHAGPPTGG